MFKPSEKAGSGSYPKKTLAPHTVHDIVIQSVTMKLANTAQIIVVTVRGKEVINELPEKYQVALGEYWCTDNTGKVNAQDAVDALSTIANVLGIKSEFDEAISKATSIQELANIANAKFSGKSAFAVTAKLLGMYNDKPYEKGFLPKYGAVHKTKELADKFLAGKLSKPDKWFTKIDKSMVKAQESSGPIGEAVEDDLPF